MSAEIPAGAMRFNSDSQKLEYWNGSAWFQVHTATPNLASAGDRQPGARGLFAGGFSPNASTRSIEIQYINIASTGNAQDFGDLLNSKNSLLSNFIINSWVIGGGNTGSDTNVADTINLLQLHQQEMHTNFGDLELK